MTLADVLCENYYLRVIFFTQSALIYFASSSSETWLIQLIFPTYISISLIILNISFLKSNYNDVSTLTTVHKLAYNALLTLVIPQVCWSLKLAIVLHRLAGLILCISSTTSRTVKIDMKDEPTIQQHSQVESSNLEQETTPSDDEINFEDAELELIEEKEDVVEPVIVHTIEDDNDEYLRQEIVDGLMQNADLELLIESAQNIHKNLTKIPGLRADGLIENGVIPRLVDLLERNDCPILQSEVASIVKILASNPGQSVNTLAELGAVNSLIPLMNSPNSKVVEESISALGNFANCCLDNLLGCGLIRDLSNLLYNSKQDVTIKRSVVSTLSKICHQPLNADQFKWLERSLPLLSDLLRDDDPEVLSHSCEALAYLCDGPKNRKQTVLSGGGVSVSVKVLTELRPESCQVTSVGRRLVELLRHESSEVTRAAMRAISNIVNGNAFQCQIILHCGALQPLKELVRSPMLAVRKQAIEVVSEIIAHSDGFVESVIEAGLFPELIIASVESGTRTEAVVAISNAVRMSETSRNYLVQISAIEALCAGLNFVNREVLDDCVFWLYSLARLRAGSMEVIIECGGVRKMEQLNSKMSSNRQDLVAEMSYYAQFNTWRNLILEI